MELHTQERTQCIDKCTKRRENYAMHFQRQSLANVTVHTCFKSLTVFSPNTACLLKGGVQQLDILSAENAFQGTTQKKTEGEITRMRHREIG